MCNNCLHEYDANVTSEITKNPTCTETGTRTYTATFDEYSDTKEETLPAINHSYQYDCFVWDGYTAKAKYICSNDNEHIEYHDAVITSIVTVEPNCSSTGTRVYTATYDRHTDTKSETLAIEPDDHDYQFDSFVWDGFTAKAKYICANNEAHIEYHDATITSEITLEPTCIATGTKVHTATYDGHNDTKNETLDLDPDNHDLVHHDQVEPTINSYGSIEYWQCNRCGKIFADSNAQNEITIEDTVIAEYVPTEVSAPVISATATAKNAITLTIMGDGKSARYDIYRATSSKGKFAFVGSTSTDEYIDETAAYGTNYYYKSMAVYDKYDYVESPYSKTVSCKISLVTPVINAEVVNNVQTRVSWDENIVAEGYEVYYATSKSGKYAKIANIEDGNEYVWDDAPSNRAAYFKVRRYVTVGTKKYYSSYSSIKSTKVTIATPTITKCVGSPFDIDLEWTGDENTTEYIIYRSTSSTKGFVAIGTTPDNSYSDNTCIFGKTYYYKVISNVRYNEHDHLSSYSSAKSAKTFVSTPSISLCTASPFDVSLEWTGDENTTKYTVYRSTNSKKGFLAIDTILGNSYVDTNVVYGKTYYYKVISNVEYNDNDHMSSYSSVKSTKISVATPSITEFKFQADETVKVSWTEDEYAEKFTLYRSTSKTKGFKEIYHGKENSYVDCTAILGKTYYYKVVTSAKVNGDLKSSSASPVKKYKVAYPGAELTGKYEIRLDEDYFCPYFEFEPVPNATDYRLYYSTKKDGKYKLAGTVATEDADNHIRLSLSDASENFGHKYYLKVEAYHIDKFEDRKLSTSSIKAVIAYLDKPIVTISEATDASSKMVTFHVENPPKYTNSWWSLRYGIILYRATSKNGTYTRISYVENADEITTEVPKGKTYYYKIKTYWSNPKYFTSDYTDAIEIKG